MIIGDWMAVARGVSIDRESGAPTLFSLIDAVVASGFPVLIQHLALLTRLRRSDDDPEQTTVTLVVIQNGSEILFQSPIDVDFQGRLRTFSTVALTGLVNSVPGTIGFRYLLEDRQLASYEMIVEGPSPVLAQADGTASTVQIAPPASPNG